MQLTHDQHAPPSHNKEIIIVCNQITSPANMGSIFRLADAFGVQEIIFDGSPPDLKSSRLRRTARNTETRILFRESEDIINTITSLHYDGFTSIALEISTTSTAIYNLALNKIKKLVLIIGSERHGICESILSIATYTAHISMYGSNSSMNVAQATGIALYEVTRK